MIEHGRDEYRNLRKQSKKTRNSQPDFNRGIQDEDALFKHLAYAGNQERIRTNEPKSKALELERFVGFDNFDNFYREQLLEDAKRPPREINKEDFVAKPKVPIAGGQTDRKDTGFLNN